MCDRIQNPAQCEEPDIGVIVSLAALAFPPLAPVAGGLLLAGVALTGLSVAGTALTVLAEPRRWRDLVSRSVDLVTRASLPGKILKLGGKVKRAIWYEDARYATGHIRAFSAAPKVQGLEKSVVSLLPISPQLYFGGKAAAGVVFKGKGAILPLGDDWRRVQYDLGHPAEPRPVDLAETVRRDIPVLGGPIGDWIDKTDGRQRSGGGD